MIHLISYKQIGYHPFIIIQLLLKRFLVGFKELFSRDCFLRKRVADYPIRSVTSINIQYSNLWNVKFYSINIFISIYLKFCLELNVCVNIIFLVFKIAENYIYTCVYCLVLSKYLFKFS